MDFVLQLSLLNSTCYPMQCNNGQAEMPISSCTFVSNGTVFLQPCESDYACQIGFETSYCLPAIPDPTSLSYPGEPCKHTFDCKYGICKNGYCQGFEAGKGCTLSAECSPGLYCKVGNCVTLLTIGKGPCLVDFECQNSAGCLDGLCVAYFSLAVGATVSVCASEFSVFCSTATCWQGQCINALRSSKTLPTPCINYQDCTSNLSSSGVIFYSDCGCGYNNQGQAYCSLFSGDDNYALYLSALSNWLSSEVSGLCNTVRRFTSQCIQMFWDKPNYQELLLYYYRTFYYAMIQKNDECIMSIYSNFYWDLIEEITFAQWLGVGAWIWVFS